jgi:hypothetical protein
MTDYIQSSYSHYIIFGGATLGLVWGAVNALFVSFLSAFRIRQETRFAKANHYLLIGVFSRMILSNFLTG